MTFRRAILNPTPQEVWLHDMMRGSWCIACMQRTVNGHPAPLLTRAEIHHLVRYGMQLGHAYTVNMCGWHHRAEPFGEYLNAEACRYHLGPSLADNKREFHARYGDNQALLDYQRDILGLPRIKIPDRAQRKRKGSTKTPSKSIPRRVA